MFEKIDNRQHLWDEASLRVEAFELRHQSNLHEVYDAFVRVGEQREAVCIKVLRRDAQAGDLMTHSTKRDQTNVFHHRAPLESQHLAELSALQRASLLVGEAYLIERVGTHWNHGVLGVGRWQRGSELTDLQVPMANASVFLSIRPEDTALVMPRWDGTTWGELSVEARREMLPAMLPAVWDALCACPHGDLNPSALLIAPNRPLFRILDPGVRLDDPECTVGDWHEAQTQFFTTNTDYYPFLVPQQGPARPRSFEADLEVLLVKDALELMEVREERRGGLWKDWSEMCAQFEGQSQRATSGPMGEWAALCDRAQRVLTALESGLKEGPAPADLQALGLMYFEVLTGAKLQDLLRGPEGETILWPLWQDASSDVAVASHRLGQIDAILELCRSGAVRDALMRVELGYEEVALCEQMLDLTLQRARLVSLTRSLGAERKR